MEAEPLMYFLLLLVSTLALYVLPFVPAIIEWIRKTDAAPPSVNFEDKTIVEYRIRIIKAYIENHFLPLVNKYRGQAATHEGKNSDGTDYIINGQSGLIPLSKSELSDKKSQRDIILCESGSLPSNIHYTQKIYAADTVEIGAMSVINELFAEKDITLQSGVKVNALMFGADSIEINPNCVLNNYTRATNIIRFLGQAEFQYLYAPFIGFGEVTVSFPETAVDVIGSDIARDILNDNFEIDANTRVTKHFLSKQSLTINSGCEVTGNIKSEKDLLIKANTHIIGALVCNSDIYIGDNCVIQGPIVSAGTIRIGSNCVIGTEDSMTSVVAENMFIGKGCLVSGMMLAKTQGIFQV